MQYTIKPRSPVLASLMSAVLPGFGQLYNGDINKAAWFFLGFTFFSVPSIALLVMYLPEAWTIQALITSLLLTFSIWLFAVIEAFKSARKQSDYLPQTWQGSGSYLLIFVLCNLILLPSMTQYVRNHYIESFRIPSGSMEPNLIPGDILFADKRYNCPGCETNVKHGDVAIFVYPNDRNRYYIKRIIGLPGDKIRIAGTQVFVNDKPISSEPTTQDKRQYINEHYADNNWQVVWDTRKKIPEVDFTVPYGEVFVLGDNRSDSNDSRYFSTVPLRDVIGKARQIWFSMNMKRGGILWERSGKVVK
jgi:signal peptidase I